MEKGVVRRDELLKGFGDIKMGVRDGTAIVNKMASALEDLLARRARAAEEIMMKAEDLTKDMDFKKYEAADSFRFDSSIVSISMRNMHMNEFPLYSVDRLGV